MCCSKILRLTAPNRLTFLWNQGPPFGDLDTALDDGHAGEMVVSKQYWESMKKLLQERHLKMVSPRKFQEAISTRIGSARRAGHVVFSFGAWSASYQSHASIFFSALHLFGWKNIKVRRLNTCNLNECSTPFNADLKPFNISPEYRFVIKRSSDSSQKKGIQVYFQLYLDRNSLLLTNSDANLVECLSIVTHSGTFPRPSMETSVYKTVLMTKL
jgi:hypothetical protein